jgi:sugar lactone lactonase YvrE
VDVTFAPLAPGIRKGAVELLDGTTVVAMTYVYGTGVGPQVAFSPSTPIKLSTGSYSNAMAIDAAGNIFATLYFNAAVEEIVAAGGYTTIKTLPINLPGAEFVAVDGAGNLFVVDHGPQQLDEVFAASGYQAHKRLASLGDFNSIVVDPAGNLFLTDFGNGTVIEMPVADNYTTTKTLTPRIPADMLAMDSAGNLFVTVLYGGIEEILATGGYTTTKLLFDSKQFGSVSVDAADNLLVTYTNSYSDTQTHLGEIPAKGGYATLNTLYEFAVTAHPTGMSVDGNGNVFYGAGHDATISELYEIPRSQPPAFVHNAVVGSSYTQSTTVQNIGNATLTGSFSLTNTADFSVAAGSGTPPDCPDSFTLASNEECNLSVNFAPQSTGPVTGSLVVADNSPSVTGTTQTIALAGTGVTAVPQVSPAILQFGSVPYFSSATLPLTITNTGTGTLTIDPSSNGPSTFITGSTCGAGIGAGKSCTLQVEFKPAKLGPGTNTLTIVTNGLTNPTVPVQGTAIGIDATTGSLDFGTVKGRGNATSLSLTVMNYGLPGNASVATETGATSFQVIGNFCVGGVSSSGFCNILVEYDPTEQGTQTRYLKLIPSVGLVQNIKMTGTLVP